MGELFSGINYEIRITNLSHLRKMGRHSHRSGCDLDSVPLTCCSPANILHRMTTKVRTAIHFIHWPERKLDRALGDVWMGRHDQTALTSGRVQKQRWSDCASSLEPTNTDIYRDACIISLCAQTICIILVLLYAMKYVNVVYVSP